MSIRVETSIWIDRPPLEVFEFMTTIEGWPTYMPALVFAERVGDGPNGVGTQIAFRIAFLGSTVEHVAEWTRFEPGVAIGAVNVDNPKMASASLTLLEQVDGGTRIHRVLDMEPHAFFVHLAAPLIQYTALRNMKAEFANIKRALEERPD